MSLHTCKCFIQPGSCVGNAFVGLPASGAAEIQAVNGQVNPRNTAAGPIPTIQEMEAEAAQDEDAQASFEEPDAADAGRHPYCSNVPETWHYLLQLRLSCKVSSLACRYRHRASTYKGAFCDVCKVSVSASQKEEARTLQWQQPKDGCKMLLAKSLWPGTCSQLFLQTTFWSKRCSTQLSCMTDIAFQAIRLLPQSPMLWTCIAAQLL